MSTPAILSMLLILTVVVGGFSYFLSLAIKKEKALDPKDQIEDIGNS
jgi:hypothetical protein